MHYVSVMMSNVASTYSGDDRDNRNSNSRRAEWTPSARKSQDVNECARDEEAKSDSKGCSTDRCFKRMYVKPGVLVTESALTTSAVIEKSRKVARSRAHKAIFANLFLSRDSFISVGRATPATDDA